MIVRTDVRCWGVFAALACAGCPSAEFSLPEGDLTYARSGERLRARFWDGEDLHAFAGFVDGLTGEPCTFREAAGERGVLRCLPRTAGAVYLDPSCQRLAVKVSRGQRYVSGDEVVFRLGDEVTLPEEAPLGYDRRTGACAPIGASLSAGYHELREVVEELDLDEFVEGQLREIDPDERLARLAVVGAEGAFAPWGWRDRLLDVECTRSELDPGRCGPVWVAPPSHFADPSCERRAVVGAAFEAVSYVWIRAVETSSAGEQDQGGLCGVSISTRSLHRREAERLPVAYERVDGRCTPMPAGVPAWALSAAQPLEILAPLSASARGSGPIQEEGSITADGRFLSGDDGLRDPGLSIRHGPPIPGLLAGSAACRPMSVGDSARCVPVLPLAPDTPDLQFSDASCTDPATSWYTPGVGTTMLVVGDVHPTLGLLSVIGARSLGSAHPGPGYLRQGGSCVALESPLSPCLVLRSLGSLEPTPEYPLLQPSGF